MKEPIVSILIFNDGKFISKDRVYLSWLDSKVAEDIEKVWKLPKDKTVIYALTNRQSNFLKDYKNKLISKDGRVSVRNQNGKKLTIKSIKMYPKSFLNNLIFKLLCKIF